MITYICPNTHCSLKTAVSADGQESSPEAPVDWDLLVKKDIVKASLWAILCYYGDVWNLNTASNKLAEIGVIQFPGSGENRGLGQRRWFDK